MTTLRTSIVPAYIRSALKDLLAYFDAGKLHSLGELDQELQLMLRMSASVVENWLSQQPIIEPSGDAADPADIRGEEWSL